MSEALRRAYREKILPYVQGPGQYIGREHNSILKDHAKVAAKVVLAFPDAYTIGMSHLGMQIFYHLLNRRPDVAAERVYCPWQDMEALLKKENLPLVSLETFTPVREFDLVCLSLQYELCATNVLTLLDRAGIPLRAEARGEGDPIVVAGGPGATNPEPFAPFVDLFVIGDGEPVLDPLVDLLIEHKRRGPVDRVAFLREAAAKIEGCYAPALYEIETGPRGEFLAIRPRFPDVPALVRGAVVREFGTDLLPDRPIVPYLETVHDRIQLEIMRGCPWKCNFCQATNLKRPLRWRTAEDLEAHAERVYRNTGLDEIALTSLSTSDYPELEELLGRLSRRFKDRRVSISVPSLRVGEQVRTMPAFLQEVRKGGMTLAPEAGSERLRAVIDKRISEEELYENVLHAYQGGWNHVKLYFMVGLPRETDEDIDGIYRMAKACSQVRRKTGQGPGKVNCTISPFAPKPHTPFQWEPAVSLERLRTLRDRFRKDFRSGPVHMKFHDPEVGYLESVLSRGDRRLADVIEEAWRRGARFDAWDEHFKYETWTDSFAARGLDPQEISGRAFTLAETLPWDHISIGFPKDFLWREHERAHSEDPTKRTRIQHAQRKPGQVHGDPGTAPPAREHARG